MSPEMDLFQYKKMKEALNTFEELLVKKYNIRNQTQIESELSNFIRYDDEGKKR